MQLTSLSLVDFKNICDASLEFTPGLNCLVGNNGAGKSNLLDAIHCLSVGRSMTGVPDTMLVRQGAEMSMVRGDYIRRDTPEQLSLGLWSNRRKSLRRGAKEVRLSEHIGNFPLVASVPQDIELVRGPAEERRHWLDLVISQSDPRYLEALIRYNSSLEQRNRMLRENCMDLLLYQAVETPMSYAAEYIFRARTRLTDTLRDILRRSYAAIAGNDAEVPDLSYCSTLAPEPDSATPDPETLLRLLAESRRRDEAVHHTTTGIHRDDILFTLSSMPMRRTASQGQCKTFTLGLKLAQYEFLRGVSPVRPLLMLDDIFDKLDAGRVRRIMQLVTGGDYGQTFITDTNRHHLDTILTEASVPHRMWVVEAGRFTPVNHEAN